MIKLQLFTIFLTYSINSIINNVFIGHFKYTDYTDSKSTYEIVRGDIVLVYNLGKIGKAAKLLPKLTFLMNEIKCVPRILVI